MKAPLRRERFFLLQLQLRGAQPLPYLGWRGSLYGPCLVPIILGRFDPLSVILHVGTIDTQFNSQTILQN